MLDNILLGSLLVILTTIVHAGFMVLAFNWWCTVSSVNFLGLKGAEPSGYPFESDCDDCRQKEKRNGSATRE